MSDAEIVVAVKGDISGGRTIKRNLDDIANSGDKATGATARLQKQVGALSQSMQILRGFAGGMIGAMGLAQLVKIADQYTLMNARLKNITGSTQEAGRAMDVLRRLTSETGSSMETSLSILQRLSFVKAEIKATNDEMLLFTETVTKMGVMSGASNEALKAGLTQLGQGLSAGIVRAEEFNSIMENIPGVGKAIADQFGVTTGKLRQLVVEGKVLSEDVFTAILNQSIETRKQFEEFPKTAQQGLAQLANSFSVVIDQLNRASNGTHVLGGTFRLLGEGIKSLYDGLGTMFDGIVASILEGINLIKMAFNTLIDAVNLGKKYIPYADKTPMDRLSSVTPGSIYKEMAEARKQRADALYDDPFAKGLDVQARSIKNDYVEIAKSIGNSDKNAKLLKKTQTELQRVVEDTYTDQERFNATVAELERLRPFANTRQEVDAIDRGIKNAREELEKLRIQAELNSPTAKAFQSLASEIDDGFKDAFKSSFREGDGGFKSLINGWKNTFKDFIAELAYQTFARPIIVPIVGAIGGMMGLSSGAVASSINGSTGGSGSFGSLSSLANLGSGSSGFSFSSIGQGLSSINSLLNGVGGNGLINSFGASLGFSPGLAAGVYGPAAPGALFGSTTLGGALAGGSIGSLAANLLGLGSGNMLVDTGLGFAGGAIGSMFGGPIGAGIGSFLGTALGGLFGGGKPSNKEMGNGIDFATGVRDTAGSMSGKKFSQENADAAAAIIDQAAAFRDLLASVGGTTTGYLKAWVGSRDGYQLQASSVNDLAPTRYSNINDVAAAALQAVLNQTTGISETFQKILNKIGTSDMEKLGKGFEFGKYFDALNAGPVDVLAEAIKALNTQFDELRAMATDLGFPLDKINEEYDRQNAAITGAIKAQQAGFANLESMTKAFESFLYGQAMGSNSSLNPMSKLQLAQETFGNLLSQAQGGDYSNTQELLTAANQLLEIGRGVYASSVSFAGLESFVRSSITEIARASGVPGFATGTMSAPSGLAWVGEKGPELVRFRGGERVFTNSESRGMAARSNAQMESKLAENNEHMSAMRKDMRGMARQFGRLANQMIVSKG